MSEPSKRNSTRQKKPPRYLQMDDNGYAPFSNSRISDPKTRSNPQELSQLAKLLSKFVTSANQKLRDRQREQQTEQTIRPSPRPQPSSLRPPPTRQHEPRPFQPPAEASLLSGRAGRNGERGGESSKGGTKGGLRRGEGGKKGTAGLSTSIESDLSYHAMLGQHIRSVLPDPRNLSHQTLMKLGIPGKQALEQGKAQELQRRKRTGDEGLGRESREQLKPFKRQSYHVAIAYHIYLKQIKTGNNPTPREIDPTYNARKLREQTNRPQ